MSVTTINNELVIDEITVLRPYPYEVKSHSSMHLGGD